MPLDEMTPKTDVPGDGTLEVDGGTDSKTAEVCTTESFGGYAYFERGTVKGSYGEAGSW